MKKYRIRPNKSIYNYKVQHKVLFWWKTVYSTGLKQNAIDYIKMVLFEKVYTKDSFKNLNE